MSWRFRRRIRTKQPVAATPLNEGNPLAEKVEFVRLGSQPLYNPTNRAITRVGSIITKPSVRGMAQEFSASNYDSYPMATATGGNTPWAVATLIMPVSGWSAGTAPGMEIIGTCEAPGTAASWDRGVIYAQATGEWGAYLYDTSAKVATTTGVAPTSGRMDSVIATTDGSFICANANGIEATPVAVTNCGFNGYSSAEFCLGNPSNKTGSAISNVPLVIRANKYWPLALRRMFAENPWQIFRKRRRRAWVPNASAGGNIAASGGAVAGGSAALSASYSLAAVAVAVAGGSAALSAAVPLAATGLAIASGSAGAVATVTIAAAALAQAAGAAGLSVTVTLAASGGAVAGGSAALAGGPVGAIAASGGAVAGGSALMSATVQISAAGLAQALGAGALSVAIPLAAFGAAVAGGQATLSTGGIDPGPLIPSGYAADLATIYADFGQTVTHHPAAGGADIVGLAILDEPGTVLLGGEQLATDYGLRYPAYIFPSIKRADTITIGAVTYTAREAAQPIGIDGLEHVVPLARAN